SAPPARAARAISTWERPDVSVTAVMTYRSKRGQPGSMRSPKDGAHSSTAIGGSSGAAAGAARPPLTGTAPRPLVADLLSLRELQASLALEETDDAVVRVGTNAIVEILAIDCGLAIVETTPGRQPLRFGWLQGRAMTAPEMDSLQRTLEREIAEVRDGSSGTRLLADAPAVPGGGAPALPASVRALGFGAVLLLGLGSGGRRSGSLVLAARDSEAFNGEPAILAEILAQQMSEQCGRVRAASRIVRMTEPVVVRNGAPAVASSEPTPGGTVQGPVADVRRLQARVRALEAQAAIAAAVSLAHDTDRQVATALKKAIELTGHVAGAIYLVETNDACDDVLRLAQGVGDEAWLETARLPRWRPGEGLPGRLWATGEGVAYAHLTDDPAG